MTEHFTHLWMKLISLVSKCMHVLHTHNCEMKDSHALPPLYAKLILVFLFSCITVLVVVVYIDVVGRKCGGVCSPSSHSIAFSPVDVNTSAKSSNLHRRRLLIVVCIIRCCREKWSRWTFVSFSQATQLYAMDDCTARDDNQYITSMRCRGCHVRVILGHTLPHGGRIYYLCVE